MDSFSFRGIHLDTYGVYLAQKNTDTHIWESEYKTNDDSVDSQDGGVWHSNTVEPKVFDLDCYFEDISEFQLTSIMYLFNREGEGTLRFDERPWLKYIARSVKKPDIEKYVVANARYSGKITFHLKAYCPFAESSAFTLDEISMYEGLENLVKDTTCLMPLSRMPITPVTTAGAPRTGQFIYSVHHAGNAKANTVIKVAGDVGDGVVIYNPLTKQTCKIIGLTKALTTNVGKWLEIYSNTGECFLTDGANKTQAWNHHDRGYIQLKEHPLMRRDILISFSGNEATASVDAFTEDDVGKHIFIGDKWASIVMVNTSKKVTINPPASSTGSNLTDIVQLNDILITPVSVMSLTKFNIEYSHTFT